MAGMGDAFPRRGLGGSAENWGRHLEQRIVGLESLIRQLTGGAANTSRQIAGAASNISSQIGSLERLLTNLERLLTNQTYIINAIPIPVVQAGSRFGYTIPNGFTDQLTLSTEWPDGKSSCSVFAVGQAFYFAPVPKSAVAAWRFVISGQVGPPGNVVPLNMDGKSTTFMSSASVGRPSSDPAPPLDILVQSVSGQDHGSGTDNNLEAFALLVFS